MAPDSGHLVDFRAFKAGPDYETLPDDLQRAARLKLAGQPEAFVSLTSGGKLARWAAGRRKARRRMVKASRKRNRP